MNDVQRKPVEFKKRELERVKLGHAPNKARDPVEAVLEISQMVRDDGTLGRPLFSVVLSVGTRFLRLDAESRKDEPSLAERVGEALVGLVSDRAAESEFFELLRSWQEENPPRRARLPEDKPNDGGPNRGLRSPGKTARKRTQRRDRT